MNKTVFSVALGILARREHSAAELLQKLLARGFDESEITIVLLHCQQQGYQSDLRYAESLCRTRINQGYGPIWVRQELKKKHIAVSIIDEVLDIAPEIWQEAIRNLLLKKFKQIASKNFTERYKKQQFLYRRGFDSHMSRAIECPED